MSKIDPYIELNDRQHGFRKTYSTSTACYSLKETVMYYLNANSDVHACFIDISKAFDSVNHNTLMNKLAKLGIPECLINLIKHWYSNQYVQVKYGSSLSEEWKISNGVRQGGVLSGLFFSIYIDSLIEKVSKSKTGCMLGIYRSNIIAYADDLVLMAPSAKSLQTLIDVAFNEAEDLDLLFNLSKTKVMVFCWHKHNYKGRSMRIHEVGNQPIEHVTSKKYLGYIIASDFSESEDVGRVKSRF